MKTLRHLALAALTGISAMSANAQYPYNYFIEGSISNCYPGQVVNIQTTGSSSPAYNFNLNVDSTTCTFWVNLGFNSTSASVVLTTMCTGVVLTAADSASFGFFGDSAYAYIAFNCGGGVPDCNGVIGGPDVPGAPCDDGDSTTVGDTWNSACVCVGGSIFSCNASFTVQQTAPWVITTTNTSTGTAPFVWSWWMPDGSASSAFEPGFTFTSPGVYGICLNITDAGGCSSWMCDSLYVDSAGTISNTFNLDCLGVPGGGNLPGTPCDDGNVLTTGDTWNSSCVCVGGTGLPCNADFWVLQAYTVDSLLGTTTPIPYTLWVWNLTSGGSGSYTFSWSFGDGTGSTDAYPTHTYAGNGPYTLCLTIADGLGCTDTYCDTISIDTSGYYVPFGGHNDERASGFTINVMAPIISGVHENGSSQDLATWPNPAGDELNVAFVTNGTGAVEVALLDAQGRIVRNERLDSTGGRTQMVLSTAGLDAGIYLLRVGDERGSVGQRIVKSN